MPPRNRQPHHSSASGDVLERLRRAIQRRESLASAAGSATNAWRLCDGSGDGIPGVFIDSFAGHWVVQTKGVPFPEDLVQTPDLGWQSLWWKRLDQHQKEAPLCVAGQQAAEVVILENGLQFRIDFQAGYSLGIFLDQREQRRAVRQSCRRGQRVLNLFAYTCAFSVAAAAAGAVAESIDLSRPCLDWGRQNFLLNGIDPAGHFFSRGDAFDWLRRLANKQRRYELVILDPPTFSRNDAGKLWRVERDYPALAAAALAVLAPSGRLLCCTNQMGLSAAAFDRLLQEGCALAGRRVIRSKPGSVPPDFTAPPGLHVRWLDF